MKLLSRQSETILRGIVAALLFALCSVCGMVFAVERDFDGDGRADILWRNQATGENYIYFMDGKVVIAEGYIRTVSDLNWKIVGVGDLDGNGRSDILWRNSSTGENYAYLMNGTTFSSEGYIRAVPDLNWKVVGIGDFDGDGRSDILWRNSSTGENYIYPMQGLTIKPSED